jgi:EAL domain-containing protein (putative c-di-GMP-specific phosphodiesterase class I)
VLGDAGYPTVEVGSAEDALDRLKAGTFCAVILDNHLPGMSGIDLVRLLRADAATATLPVLILTSDGTRPQRLAGLGAGATDFVVKPFDAEELVARIEAHLRSDRTWRERWDAADSPAQADRVRSDVRSILNARAFFPVFQPVVDLRALVVVGYEALTRFDDGTPPERLFQQAAGAGVGTDLELVTIEAAVAAARRLDSERFLSLNVSSDLVMHHTGALQDLLAERDRTVVLELTEHEAVADYATLRERLAWLEPEVEVSVDDAGAGFSSLRHVVMLEPTYVKLDRSWITGIKGDPTRQAMVAGLSLFARQACCQLVAEGIEVEEELAALEELDVDLGQGYLLGPPSEELY